LDFGDEPEIIRFLNFSPFLNEPIKVDAVGAGREVAAPVLF
jgi:hypothetical protein